MPCRNNRLMNWRLLLIEFWFCSVISKARMSSRRFTSVIWPKDCCLAKVLPLMLRRACWANWKLVCCAVQRVWYDSEALTIYVNSRIPFLYPPIECGSGFTTKLEGMFKDMDISKDVMANFRVCPTWFSFALNGPLICLKLTLLLLQCTFQASKMHGKIGQLDLSVNVLTQGHWPTYAPVEANLPPHVSSSWAKQWVQTTEDFISEKK